MADRARSRSVTRNLRRRDEAAGSLASFVVGAAVFMLSSATLVHFLVEPPGSAMTGLDEAVLKARGRDAMDVFLGTPGYPAAWDATAANVDSVRRLGILEAGSTLRIDPDKFGTMAKGSYLNPSRSNGFVDYAEAKVALGLSGYDFHVRGAPIFSATDAVTYGIDGLGDYHVGYVGHWDGALESAASVGERSTLAYFGARNLIKFSDAVRLSTAGTGDVYKDDPQSLRSVLVPLLGASPAQTVISNGAGTKHDFRVVNASFYSTNFDVVTRPTLTRALVLSDGTAAENLGYTKNRELRSILGSANMTGLVSADLTWKEWVDANDAGDYGWIEVSPNGGQAWYRLTDNPVDRSQDHDASPQFPANGWKLRATTINSVNCGPCAGNKEVQIALHWVADNDDPTGKGWIVDDVQLSPTLTTSFSKTFERPQFDLLIVGSDTDQDAFTAAEVKYAIRDYVNIYGGRLVVLGGHTNTNWLQPTFNVGIRSASPGVAAPDVTHPLLTVPNELDWQEYDYGNTAWDFGGNGASAALFNMVVGAGTDQHIFSASRQGAFSANAQEGVVVLTTYLPYAMDPDQAKRFLANVLMYGRYHHLYLDFGPPVPTRDSSVASVTRTAVMDKTRSADASYIEMAIVLYIWEGGPATDAIASHAVPTRPLGPIAVPGNSQVVLEWTRPASDGAGKVTGYDIYRATSPGMQTLYRSICNCTRNWIDLNLTNGQTYYYHVVARNQEAGAGSASEEFSATPAQPASVPQGFSASGAPQAVALSWTPPASNGGSSIVGYTIFRNDSSGAMVAYASIGNELSYRDLVVDPLVTYRYQVAAVNSIGNGIRTAEATASPLNTPPAPTLVATGGFRENRLVWNVSGAGGSPLQEYRIYSGPHANSMAFLASVDDNTVTYTHAGLGDGQTVLYRVSAVNAVEGEGPQSTGQSATTVVVPSVPVGVTVTNATSGANNLTIRWLPPVTSGLTAVTGYTVWGGNSAGGRANLTFIEGSGTEWTDRGLPNNATRWYTVTASNEQGEGSNSTEVSGRTLEVPYPPILGDAAPGIGTTGRIQLVYTAPAFNGGAPILYYKVYRTLEGGVGEPEYRGETVPATGLAYVTGLQAGMPYGFRMTAVTAAGESGRSNRDDGTASTL